MFSENMTPSNVTLGLNDRVFNAKRLLARAGISANSMVEKVRDLGHKRVGNESQKLIGFTGIERPKDN